MRPEQVRGETHEHWMARVREWQAQESELAERRRRTPAPTPAGQLWQPPRARSQHELNEEQTRLELARAVARREAPRRLAAMDAAEFAAAGRAGDDGDDEERFTVLSADDLRGVDALPDLVDGMVGPPGTLNMLNGYRGSMKSLTALGLAGAVGGGDTEVYGLAVTRACPVLYAYLEGASGLSRRLRAWEAHHSRPMAGVHFIHGALDLKRPDDVRALALLSRKLGAGLVILDSVAKTGGGREDAEDFGAYRAGLEALRDATGAAVLVLHNSGHDRSRARGHTTLVDGVDSAVVLVPRAATEGGGTSVRDEKSRDTPALDDLQLAFEPAGPLNAATGKAWSGVVVRQTFTDSLNTAMAALNEAAEKALEAIDGAGGSIAPKALREALGMSEKATKTLMTNLEADGKVTTNGLGTRAMRYLRAPS